jgi:hypothetical protein
MTSASILVTILSDCSALTESTCKFDHFFHKRSFSDPFALDRDNQEIHVIKQFSSTFQPEICVPDAADSLGTAAISAACRKLQLDNTIKLTTDQVVTIEINI